MGIIALYVALGGVAWAATISANDIKPNAVRSKHIRSGEVRASDVRASDVQLRVGATCQPGQSIRAITQAGTVTCEIDDAGPGGPIADGSITSAKIADETITGVDIANRGINGGEIAEATLSDFHMVGDSLTSPVIKDGTILPRDLSANAIPADGTGGSDGSTKLATNSVAFDEIALNTVRSSLILDGGVAADDLATNSVNSAKVQDNSLTGSDINESSLGPGLDVYKNQVAGPQEVNDESDSIVGRLLPAGTWLVFVQFETEFAVGYASDNLRCEIDPGNADTLDVDYYHDGDVLDRQGGSHSMMGIVTTTGSSTNVSAYCDLVLAAPTDEIEIYDADFVALPVDQVL